MDPMFLRNAVSDVNGVQPATRTSLRSRLQRWNATIRGIAAAVHCADYPGRHTGYRLHSAAQVARVDALWVDISGPLSSSKGFGSLAWFEWRSQRGCAAQSTGRWPVALPVEGQVHEGLHHALPYAG